MIFQMEKLAFVAQNIWRKTKKKSNEKLKHSQQFLFIVLS